MFSVAWDILQSFQKISLRLNNEILLISILFDPRSIYAVGVHKSAIIRRKIKSIFGPDSKVKLYIFNVI